MRFVNGYMLIEFMIGLLISLLVIFCLTPIYIATERSQSVQIALNTIMDNANVASHFLHTDIVTAGYMGCARLTNRFPLVNTTHIEFNAINKIVSDASSDMKPGSQAVTIRKASMQSVSLVKNMRSYSILYVSNTLAVSSGDVLLISDCKTADLFTVKEVQSLADNTQKIISEQPLSALYKLNAEVRQLEVNTYFIGETERKTQRDAVIFSLYKKDIHQHKLELVEGINDMKVNIDVNQKGQQQGVSIELNVGSLNDFILQKIWFIYVALRD
jgi:hypothetical protein